MEYISNEGAKVLHDRCVNLAEKNNIPIEALSTFTNCSGTNIGNISTNNTNQDNNIEDNELKCIIKNDNILLVKVTTSKSEDLLKRIINENMNFKNLSINNKEVLFTIRKEDKDILEKILNKYNCKFETKHISQISIVGAGISYNQVKLKEILNLLSNITNKIILISINAYKITFLYNSIVTNNELNEIHNKIFKK